MDCPEDYREDFPGDESLFFSEDFQDDPEEILMEVEKIKGKPALMSDYHDYRAQKGFKSNKKNCSFGAACFFKDIYSFNPNIVRPHDLGFIYDNKCEFCDARYWAVEGTPVSKNSEERIYKNCCGKFPKQLMQIKDKDTNQFVYKERVNFQPFIYKDKDSCPMAKRLNQLLSYKVDELSKAFVLNVRKINTTLSFASTIVNKHIIDKVHHGPPTIMVQGNIAHKLGSLEPLDGKKPQYAQAYVYEAIEKLTNYFQFSEQIKNIVDEVRGYIKQHNQFAIHLKAAYDKFQSGEQKIFIRTELINEYHVNDEEEIRQAIASAPPRTYNIPTVQEIAMLTNVDNDAFGSRENPFKHKGVVIHKKNGDLEDIDYKNALYFPASYVLLYRYGESGWYPELQVGSHRVTLREYAAYICQIRDERDGDLEKDVVVSSEMLFQQFVCDLFSCIEADRLNYLQFNQKQMRSDLYKGVQAKVNKLSPSGKGKYYILPSTFIGSMRWYNEQYLDAMARVTKFGAPDLFITMTCNPKWREIQEAMRKCQRDKNISAVHRPDIVARVFNAKMKSLIKDLEKEKIFGDTLGYQAVVEYQKRGLPHAHILLWLAPDYKPKTFDHYDRISSAEIPDPTSHPRLHELVKQHMIHNPCSGKNRKQNCPCMVNGVCKARFPRPYCSKTTQVDNGYPQLRRLSPQEGGHVIETQNSNGTVTRITNNWVVPYNAYLLLRYECHINVEIVNTISAIKYLFKYIYKATSKSIVTQREESVDASGCCTLSEIKSYQTHRYYGPAEAMYRILQFEVSDYSPPVQRLALHLDGEQRVPYEEGLEEEALYAADRRGSMLLAFFKAIEEDNRKVEQMRREGKTIKFVPASELTYLEFPRHFTFTKAKQPKNGPFQPCFWARAGKNKKHVIGRIYHISPNQEDLYFMRTLLCYVKGPISYNDLKLFEGIQYNSFREACVARGLLHDDDEWKKCLREAVLIKPSVYLVRALFAIIVYYNKPQNPVALWEEFKDDLSDDFRRKRNVSAQVIEEDYYQALRQISKL